MKIKSKILMAVLAVFFLAAGSVSATPIDVSYAVSGVAGNYELDFSITNNLVGFTAYNFSLEVAPTSMTVPTTELTYYGIVNGDYLRFDINSPIVAGDTITGLNIYVASLPTEILYTTYLSGPSQYQGTDATILNGYSRTSQVWRVGFAGTAIDPVSTDAVPEPATLLLLSFGLVGIAGVRRKIKK